MHRFERYAIAQYLENLVMAFGHRSRIAGLVSMWLYDEGSVIGIEIPEDDDELKALDPRHRIRKAYGYLRRYRKSPRT